MQDLNNTPPNSNFVTLKEKFRSGFQAFCDGTSMHGFLELIRAKSTFWKGFWIITVTASIAVTGYQVEQAVDQFINQSTLTTIESLSKADFLYPPLKVCLSHFVYWIDWDKVNVLEIHRPAVLEALSYLYIVYSNETFDYKSAEVELTKTMLQLNFTTLTELYKVVAMNVSKLFWLNTKFYDKQFAFKVTDLFTDTELTFLEMEETKPIFCYIASSENLFNYFALAKERKERTSFQAETKNILELSLITSGSETYNGNFPSLEYASYIFDWFDDEHSEFEAKEMDKSNDENVANYLSVKIPHRLFVDGFSDNYIPIMEDMDSYVITVKAMAHRYRSTTRNPCGENVRFISSNSTCKTECLTMANVKAYQQVQTGSNLGNCLQVRFWYQSGLDIPDYNCKNVVQFLDSASVAVEEDVILHDESENYGEAETPDERDAVIQDLMKKCSSKCLNGCEKWNFEYSIAYNSLPQNSKTVAKKQRVSITVQYPPDGDTLIMIDVDSQSWEGFVGNVGGLLGIWTGASILSFIQLVYLCCCSESTFNLKCWRSSSKPEIISVTPSKKNGQTVQRRTVTT